MIGFKKINQQSIPTCSVLGGPLDGNIIYINPLINTVKDPEERRKLIQTAVAVDMFADSAEQHIITGRPVKCTVSSLHKDVRAMMSDDVECETPAELQKQMKDIAKQLTLPDGEFNILPDLKQRTVCYVAAPSGAGKSYWTSKFLSSWRALFPDNIIFIFSRVTDDEAFDMFDNVIRIDLNDEYIENPLSAYEIPHGSMCIFDDIDTLPLKLKKAVESTRDDILEIGRHNKIHCVCTSHVLTDRDHTKRMINEATHVVLFPGANKEAIKKFLRDKLGLVKQQIDRCISSPSRWICVYTRFPRHIITQNQIFMV